MAKKYYERAMISSESIDDEEAGYYLYSIYHLGIIAQSQGELELAELYYKKTKKKSVLNLTMKLLVLKFVVEDITQ